MKITLVYLQGNQLWTGTETVKRGEPFDASLDWFCKQSKLIRSRLGVVVDGVIHPPVERVPADPRVQWDAMSASWKPDPKQDPEYLDRLATVQRAIEADRIRNEEEDKTEQTVPQKESETEQDVPKKKRRRGSK